jgi:hypothetical protein
MVIPVGHLFGDHYFRLLTGKKIRRIVQEALEK